MQIELIARPVHLTRAAARQAAMVAAKARADRGMAQSESSAEWSSPGWCALAVEKLREFALTQEMPWTIELARTALVNALPPPPELRAWGAVTGMALNAGYIERVPGGFMPAASSNGAPKAVYRRGVNA